MTEKPTLPSRYTEQAADAVRGILAAIQGDSLGVVVARHKETGEEVPLLAWVMELAPGVVSMLPLARLLDGLDLDGYTVTGLSESQRCQTMSGQEFAAVLPAFKKDRRN